MRKMQWAVLVAVMAAAIGWWPVQARGEETNRSASASPIPRFTIQADTNCVVDNATGLMWARNANLPGAPQTWAQAAAFCKTLNYGGHSDWRLPNLMEYYGLLNKNFPRPRLSNTEGTAKWKEGDPFTGVQPYGAYWMTTTTAGEPAGSWLIDFPGDMCGDNAKETTHTGYVWPVRDMKSPCAPSASGWTWFRFFSKPCLVEDGKPCADIVISAKPPRAAKLAALELRTYIAKISGAKLPIVTAPGTNVPVHIYVGKSEYTDQLKVADDGLMGGAFRMVSGKDYLVLLGHDKDFTLSEYADHQYPPDPKTLKAWDERTGAHWLHPFNANSGAHWGGYSPTVGIWELDERGTLNAVYEFLRGLGVRWYMPGDLGEIVPEQKIIALAPVNKTVKPNFPYRNFGDYSPAWKYGNRDGMLFKFRSGVDASASICGYHGLCDVVGREEVKKAHPEFYANHKSPLPNDLGAQCCLSSPELIAETVKYARTVFDIHPDLKHISIMPNDGFWSGNMCQCDLCKGKQTPSRGDYGTLSDYVWDFVERVAREVYKTHPDRKVICLAYGAYMLPPEKIAKFSPNVMVSFNRESYGTPEDRARAREALKGFLDKLAPGNLQGWAHYLGSGSRLPCYFPHAIAEDLHSLKGISQGEFIEQNGGGMVDMFAPGFNHLNMYVTMRYYWDADQDIEALLNEYYEKFYGPAAKEMKAFIEYSEKNWQKMSNDAAPIGKALELLATARKAAGDTVYGQRIDLLADYCQKPMTDLHDRLLMARTGVPHLRLVRPPPYSVTIDGRLDEPLWNEGWFACVQGLAELETGRGPLSATSFGMMVVNRTIYLGIRCNDHDMQNLNIATTNNDDPAMFKGDYVELLLETQGHSYYRIAVNPAGAVFDADMKNGTNPAWSSSAQIAVFKGDTFWSVEMRIPFGNMTAGGVDPTKSVEGLQPSELYPWAFNVCRQRVSGTETERSAWSPTGTNSFYVPLKFGVVSDSRKKSGGIGGQRRADYLSDRRAALALVQAGTNAEALTAFTNMAAGASSELQKSDALEQAVWCANRLRQYDRALELAKAIPIPAVSKKCRMILLCANGKYSELIAEFKAEDIDQWPESARGEAFFSRGKAFVQLKDGPAAAADLKKAAEYSGEANNKPGLAWQMLGDMCRDLLKDDQKALAAYAEGVKMLQGGTGPYYTLNALFSAADILRKEGKYNEALEMFGKIDLKKQAGGWGHTYQAKDF